MRYPLPQGHECYKCGTVSNPMAEFDETLFTWNCNSCGQQNHGFINSVEFRIGSKLLLSAQRFLQEGEHDLAAIMLYSAVDASLGRGIIELGNWRRIENLQPTEEAVESDLARMNIRQKIEKYQELAGATVDQEIERLLQSDRGRYRFLQGVTSSLLREKFELVACERHGLLHYGKDVNEEVVRDSIPWVRKAITLLDSMYRAAFDQRKRAIVSEISPRGVGVATEGNEARAV